jgi:hypothetical protein
MPTIIDQSNFGNNNGWSDVSTSGTIDFSHGQKVFTPTSDSAYTLGHYRTNAIVGAAGQFYRQSMKVSSIDSTDCMTLLRDKPGLTDNSGVGIYFTGGVALFRDGSNHYGDIQIAIEANKFYEVKIYLQDDSFVKVWLDGHFMGTSQAPYPYLAHELHLDFWVSRVGGAGSGEWAAVDNYRVWLA